MNDTIPDWAVKRACELLNAENATAARWLWSEHKGHHCITAIAKLVMQHEKPPVDPDEEAVKRIIAAYLSISETSLASGFESFARAVSQYKQEKANG